MSPRIFVITDGHGQAFLVCHSATFCRSTPLRQGWVAWEYRMCVNGNVSIELNLKINDVSRPSQKPSFHTYIPPDTAPWLWYPTPCGILSSSDTMLGLSKVALLYVYAAVAYAKTVSYDFSVGYVTVCHELPST